MQDRREGQVETRTLKTNLSPPSVAMRSFHARKMVLAWIEAHIIRQLCPLSFGEEEKMRACWNVMYREDFPTLALDRTNVKNRIVEMYAATTSRLKQSLVENVAKDQILHLSLDVWTDKFSSLKFMGEQGGRGMVGLGQLGSQACGGIESSGCGVLLPGCITRFRRGIRVSNEELPAASIFDPCLR